MSEIGSTSSTSWPVNRVAPTVTDNKQSSKRQHKKSRGQGKTEDALVEQNNKKQPPDSDVNSHIDEYV